MCMYVQCMMIYNGIEEGYASNQTHIVAASNVIGFSSCNHKEIVHENQSCEGIF